MKCHSISTTNIDPYEAGLEIGDGLASISPEAVIVFASVHYADFTELFDGIYDGLDTQDVIILGGTGDGFYETNCVDNIGVCAMGLNGEGKVEWTLALEGDISADSYRAGETCATKVLNQADSDVKLAFVMAGMACDGRELTAGIRNVLKAPCIGGLTGDDRQFSMGIVLANGKMYQDAVGILAMSGDFSYAINAGSGWTPMGQAGVVSESERNYVARIGDSSTVDFVNRQFGKPPTEADNAVLSLASYELPDPDQYALRTPLKIHYDEGAITYFGSIEEGTPVRVCYATREDVINGVNDALDGLPELDFEPVAALIISCSGRKWILGSQTAEEVTRLQPHLPPSLPLIGLPTFGEIAPYANADGTYTDTYFHNVTYALTLIGNTS